MPWIAVHEDVLGSKLRGLRKSIKCSDAEALGILTYMWLWARKNTDKTGLIANADREDVAKALSSALGDHLNPENVVSELVANGWIDEIDGNLYVHDWQEWQSYWYSYVDRKNKDKERKQKERKNERTASTASAETETTATDVNEQTAEEGKNPVKEKKPPKTKYAESVRMYTHEYDKLVADYGKPFADKLVIELNNYKLANGKTYKDDYRAILNWVIDKCTKKYPELIQRSQTCDTGNPFDDYK